ncbi:energy-coupling factor ABC transporter permease [Acuticoccus yangtzensis]|uniref:energy-coupling factor ABC transporter permease n=1 Tax=Acuticoccus yangtzensis TaxID=1443441 RepID=UPI0009496994|nr:energy-coupling factor ABC transporter permease [Acuticoccus yangtzensis]
MHIEPGIVHGAKMMLSLATAAGGAVVAGKLAFDTVRQDGVSALLSRSVIATAAVFCFFQVLPHYPVGVSEVHFILGSTLFLILGGGPAAIGLAAGLLLQGLFFAPADLPMYAVNVTTLLVPLWAVSVIAKRIIAPNTAYVDLTYRQALVLSTTYQGGIVAWVAFWAFYGQGFGAANLESVASFGGAYMLVVLAEPLVDLAVLAGAKMGAGVLGSALVSRRVYQAA